MQKENFTIVPKDIRAGVPITVTIRDTSSTALTVVPDTTHHLAPFQVPLRGNEQERTATFVVSLAGNYRLEAGGISHLLRVDPQRDLSFSNEFGFFAFFVVLIVGGMLLWLKRKMKPVAEF